MALCQHVTIERAGRGFEISFNKLTLCAGCSLVGGDSRAGVNGKDILVIFQDHRYRRVEARRLRPLSPQCQSGGEVAPAPSLLVAGDEGSFGGELASECSAWAGGRSPRCPGPAVLRQLTASAVLQGNGSTVPLQCSKLLNNFKPFKFVLAVSSC